MDRTFRTKAQARKALWQVALDSNQAERRTAKECQLEVRTWHAPLVRTGAALPRIADGRPAGFLTADDAEERR